MTKMPCNSRTSLLFALLQVPPESLVYLQQRKTYLPSNCSANKLLYDPSSYVNRSPFATTSHPTSHIPHGLISNNPSPLTSFLVSPLARFILPPFTPRKHQESRDRNNILDPSMV
ncbi:hypothetical protein BJ875DRAFT_232214 [Amylocarpus encephaloides]|uniref:Uncharacterized protein n=1 Tax=Amylocarpus encephaloides TaxID=45428 RepID=A0A9P8C7I7_9HELO|nr:hypothetical protein BJ875DRAFT_232214 [Amylocarpus encephaloides]